MIDTFLTYIVKNSFTNKIFICKQWLIQPFPSMFQVATTQSYMTVLHTFD